VSLQRRDAAASGGASQRALGQQRSQALRPGEVSLAQEKSLSTSSLNIESGQRQSQLGRSLRSGPGDKGIDHGIG
jgi:hypothetical protein